MSHHTDDAECPLCEEKLATAHKDMQSWYRRHKKRNPTSHISWAWRGQADQDHFFKEGKTKCQFPKSKHNFMDENSQPCSKALDLFQIDDDGNARFSPLWYAKVNAENEADKEPIAWGGKFKTLGDGDHFQLKD